MPIRGHSGVQGGAEMGAYATAFPGGLPVDAEHAAALAAQWGFDVPDRAGLTAGEQVEAAERGELDVLFVDGGNFLDVLPDPPRVAAALERVPLRVHQDIVLDQPDVRARRRRHPAAGGDPLRAGGRRHRDHDRAPGGLQPRDPPPGGRGPQRVAHLRRPRRAGPARSAPAASPGPTNRDLRAEIAEVVPAYAGIEDLARTGDAIQWGGRHLCAGGDVPDAVGTGPLQRHRTPVRTDLPDGSFFVSTRRGKQFNSMVFAATDPLTGAGRDAVFIDAADAAELGILDEDEVVLTSATGTMTGRARLVRLAARTLQVHWPEGNVLIAAGSGAPRARLGRARLQRRRHAPETLNRRPDCGCRGPSRSGLRAWPTCRPTLHGPWSKTS